MHNAYIRLVLATLIFSAIATSSNAEPKQAFVFFSEWSALIDQDASSAIQHAANLAKASTTHTVVVKGYADTTGSQVANQYLSQLRSQVVTDLLIEDGVPLSSIKQEAMGETPAPADSTQESRRVSIIIGE